MATPFTPPPQAGDRVLATVGVDPRQRAGGDLADQHGAVGHPHRPLGKLQSFGDDRQLVAHTANCTGTDMVALRRLCTQYLLRTIEVATSNKDAIVGHRSCHETDAVLTRRWNARLVQPSFQPRTLVRAHSGNFYKVFGVWLDVAPIQQFPGSFRAPWSPPLLARETMSHPLRTITSMEFAAAQVLLDEGMSFDIAAASRERLESAIGSMQRLIAVCQARVVALAARLGDFTTCPDAPVAAAGRMSPRGASNVMKRARTVERVPELGKSFAEGKVSSDHVDALGSALARVSPSVADQLAADGDRLALIAERTTPDRFAKVLADETRRLEAEADETERVARLKAAVRLKSFVDDAGMGRWLAWLDPDTYAMLEPLIDAQVNALFHDRPPEHCPTDPIEKQQFLRAHALVSLITGGGARLSRPELIVVRDERVTPERFDCGVPGVELSTALVRAMERRALVFNVVVCGGDIVSAPGVLNLGRTSRLANRAQRRALFALYRTCAIPGCDVRYWRTKLHHVHYWEHGGATDLHNLLPLCQHHHDQVHRHCWMLTLGPGRLLRVTLPDGTIMANGPPNRQAA